MMEMLNRIKRRLLKMRLQPIRVYCLHHVCAEFKAESMIACDWMDIGMFKLKVAALQKSGVEFISLSEAYRHLCDDKVRCKKYAVLTFDDGYASIKEILPWLEVQKIPVTLFINGKYLDGKSYRKNPKERYLTREDLWELTSPLIEIANHGWEHIRATEMTEDEFVESVENNVCILQSHPNYVPFWAYTYGVRTIRTNNCLYTRQLIPVYVNGEANMSYHGYIGRELLDVDSI